MKNIRITQDNQDLALEQVLDFIGKKDHVGVTHEALLFKYRNRRSQVVDYNYFEQLHTGTNIVKAMKEINNGLKSIHVINRNQYHVNK